MSIFEKMCGLFFNSLTEMGLNAAFVLSAAVILCLIVPYLLGSLNFGIIVSEKLFHDDVRGHGSGNAGSTNMLRSYGKKAAALTLIGDALKTAVSCWFGFVILGMPGMYLCGLLCIIGHMFPLYYKFKGGKGIVCLGMTVLCTDPLVFLILFTIFAIIILGTKYVSLGSVIGAMLYPIVMNRFGYDGIIELITIAIAALIVYKHWGNLKRLTEGTENKLNFGKKKKTADSSKEKK